MRIPLVHLDGISMNGTTSALAVVGYQRDNGATVLAEKQRSRQRLKLTGDWLEIVGIAKTLKNRSLSEPPQPFLYLPLLQDSVQT